MAVQPQTSTQPELKNTYLYCLPCIYKKMKEFSVSLDTTMAVTLNLKKINRIEVTAALT